MSNYKNMSISGGVLPLKPTLIKHPTLLQGYLANLKIIYPDKEHI